MTTTMTPMSPRLMPVVEAGDELAADEAERGGDAADGGEHGEDVDDLRERAVEVVTPDDGGECGGHPEGDVLVVVREVADGDPHDGEDGELGERPVEECLLDGDGHRLGGAALDVEEG